MQIIPVRSLEETDFRDLGAYRNLTDPTGAHRGQHYYDKLLFPVSGIMQMGVSIYVAEPPEEEIIINFAERNLKSAEIFLPLDGDVLCYAAPPSRVVHTGLFQAFIIPKGTLVLLNAGVWHRDCFALGDGPVHVMLESGQLSYANGDIEHTELPFGDWVRIDPDYEPLEVAPIHI